MLFGEGSFRKTVESAVAAAMLSLGVASAEEANNPSEIDREIAELDKKRIQLIEAKKQEEQKERLQERANWLQAAFPGADLSLGTPKVTVRGGVEQYGIYKDNTHIGDIYSIGKTFTEDTFIREVSRVTGIEAVNRKDKIQFNIGDGVFKTLEDQGCSIVNGSIIRLPAKVGEQQLELNLNSDGKTKEVTLTMNGSAVNVEVTNINGGTEKAVIMNGQVFFPAK